MIVEWLKGPFRKPEDHEHDFVKQESPKSTIVSWNIDDSENLSITVTERYVHICSEDLCEHREYKWETVGTGEVELHNDD